MEKLSMGTYTGLSVLGGEIVFTVFMVYGLFLTGTAAAMQLSLFKMLPGFTGFNFMSWLLGALTIGVISALTGSFIAWIHNASEEY